MFKRTAIATGISLALALSAWNAHAVLERVGPVSNAPTIGGFPAWYQDTTGLALEFCDPKNQAELEGGWCLLLPGDAVLPESFPENFFDEHFWYAADALLESAQGESVRLVLGVEAAFAVGPAVPGDQVAFSRIRLRFDNVPTSGNYRFIHPYGEQTVFSVAGERIFVTEDIGINCGVGKFDCAMNSALGPFLLPSNTPGGAELPPVSGPVPGKLYIADPGRSGPVTGSTLGTFVDSGGAVRDHNIFRVEGPVGSNIGGPGVDYIETTDFTLMGRIFTGVMPGRVDVDRASYARNGTGNKVDVFASGSETTQGRLPAQPRPAPIVPQLSFFDAACAGTAGPDGSVLPPYRAPGGASETQMASIQPGLYWAQVQPGTIPQEVCVKDAAARDAAGNVVPVYLPERVTDEVTVSEATYDGPNRTLRVKASSSDEIEPPELTLAFGTYRGTMTGGEIVVPDMIASPASVRVFSGALGSDQQSVRTTFGSAPPPTSLNAVNDSYAVDEDSGASTLDILANDSGTDGGSVAITAQPRLGSALVNADGSVSYTPSANANGADQFTYTVSLGAEVSNTATVSIEVLPVNDVATAVDDNATAIAGTSQTISVLSNDTDPDGAADLVAATDLTQPVGPGTASTSLAGPLVTFLADTAGTYTFTYRAQDSAGVASANTATVTVNVSAAETISFTRSEYVTSKGRLRAAGNISPAANQTVAIEFVDGLGTVLGAAGSATANAAGGWALDVFVPLPNGATALKATSSNGSESIAAMRIK